MNKGTPFYLARIRTPLLLAGLITAFSALFHDVGWIWWTGIAMIIVAFALMVIKIGLLKRPAIEVRSPVTGRWMAVNSPADKIPSHGTHEYGQAYAIDLLYQPDPDATWKSVVAWPIARRPDAFPGFGQPIYSPVDGTVVSVGTRQRDHWSRNSWPALAYLMVVEGIVRGTLAPFVPSVLLGNHVILDLGDGVYAALAHLRRGSVRVRPGDRVQAGQQLGEAGNSGNSSEPHLHFQLMDNPRMVFSSGLPFTFEHVGVPNNQKPFMAAQ